MANQFKYICSICQGPTEGTPNCSDCADLIVVLALVDRANGEN